MPFHVPPNVLHGCDSSLVGRQRRSVPDPFRHRPRLFPMTSSPRKRYSWPQRHSNSQSWSPRTRTSCWRSPRRSASRPAPGRRSPTSSIRSWSRPARRRRSTAMTGRRTATVDDRGIGRRVGCAPTRVRRRRRDRARSPTITEVAGRRSGRRPRSTCRAPGSTSRSTEPPAEWELAVGGDATDEGPTMSPSPPPTGSSARRRATAAVAQRAVRPVRWAVRAGCPSGRARRWRGPGAGSERAGRGRARTGRVRTGRARTGRVSTGPASPRPGSPTASPARTARAATAGVVDVAREGPVAPTVPQGDDGVVEEVVRRSPRPMPCRGEQVEVEGYLDMRDEGYGFLRVKGYLPSRDDSYIPVKLARQYGLRKGDHVTGAQPSGRSQREEPGAPRRSTPSTAATPRRRAGGPGSRTSRRCSPTSACASRTRRTRRT